MSFGESNHFYLPDGRPFYEVPNANGILRSVTLRDARKVGAMPSVTTVLQVLAKPALENWKVRQGILAALTLPRIADEPEDTWLDRIHADSRAQAQAAADEGTRIHDAIEKSFIGQRVPDEYKPHVEAARAEIQRLFSYVTDWVAEKSFAHPSGYGGKVDLHSPSTGIVIDYKGKDGDFSDGKKLAYEQHYQLAAYQHGLDLPRMTCANIFVSRTHPGKVTSHLWFHDDIDYGLKVFLKALELWQLLKRYDSSIPDRAIAA
jgi:hypothetical protein